MYKIITIILMALVVMLTFACTKKNKSKESAFLTISMDLRTLNPIHSGQSEFSIVSVLLYDRLLEISKDHSTLQPALLQSLPTVSKDEKTYSFELKQGILFNNSNKELTTDVVIESLNRVMTSTTDSKMANLLSRNILKILKKDNYNFQILLKEKFPDLLKILSLPQLSIAQHIDSDQSNGTGPYLVKSWEHQKKLHLVKNENWWNKDKLTGLISQVQIQFNNNSQDNLEQFLKAESDILYLTPEQFKDTLNPTGTALNESLTKKQIQLHESELPDLTYIAFNLKDPVIKKGGASLRKAISLALPKEQLIEQFYDDKANPAKEVMPRVLQAGIQPRNEYYEVNKDKAKNLLMQSGFLKNNTHPALSFDLIKDEKSKVIGEFITKNLADIGLKVTVIENDLQQFNGKLKANKSQMWGAGWQAKIPSAEIFFHEMLAIQKPVNVTKSYDKFFIDFPFIPLAHRRQLILSQPWVKNIVTDYSGTLTVDSFMKETVD